MPADFAISLAAKGGAERLLLNPGAERMHSMRGFEDTYVDIIDYIVRITHRIWEEKDIGYIYDTYRRNSRVYDDYGLQYGSEKIVADTVHTINAFPDIRLFADEIIWAGDDVSGFHTSHRTVISGHNTGFSRYGPPTGKKALLWCIANCVALENEIFNEWVIYDTASLIRQLGFDLREMARKFGNEIDSDTDSERAGEAERLPGQGKPEYLPPGNETGFDVEEFIRRAYHNIWNRRSLNDVRDAYHPRCGLPVQPGAVSRDAAIINRISFPSWRCSPIWRCKSMISIGWATTRTATWRPCAGASWARIAAMASMGIRPADRSSSGAYHNIRLWRAKSQRSGCSLTNLR